LVTDHSVAGVQGRYVQVLFVIFRCAPLAPKKFFFEKTKTEKQKNQNRRDEKLEKVKLPESLEKRKRLQEIKKRKARTVLDLPPLPAASDAQPEATHSLKESPPSQQCPQRSDTIHHQAESHDGVSRTEREQ
jgi:hypothetical protein